MTTKTTVIVTLQVEGLHCWPMAKEIMPEVSFLSDPHRNIFHIKAALQVTHSDRDREFIMFKRDIANFLHKRYYLELQRIHDFGPKSCEMIAAEILDVFGCEWVEVFEDGENGARVELV